MSQECNQNYKKEKKKLSSFLSFQLSVLLRIGLCGLLVLSLNYLGMGGGEAMCLSAFALNKT